MPLALTSKLTAAGLCLLWALAEIAAIIPQNSCAGQAWKQAQGFLMQRVVTLPELKLCAYCQTAFRLHQHWPRKAPPSAQHSPQYKVMPTSHAISQQSTKMCCCPRSLALNPAFWLPWKQLQILRAKQQRPLLVFLGPALGFHFSDTVFACSGWKDHVNPEITAGTTQKPAVVFSASEPALQAMLHAYCLSKGANCFAAPAMKQWFIGLQGAEETKTVHVNLEDGKKQCKKAQPAQAEGNISLAVQPTVCVDEAWGVFRSWRANQE